MFHYLLLFLFMGRTLDVVHVTGDVTQSYLLILNYENYFT